MHPHEEASSGTKLGQVDLSSDVPPLQHLMVKNGTRLCLGDLSSVVTTVDISSGQEWSYIRSA